MTSIITAACLGLPHRLELVGSEFTAQTFPMLVLECDKMTDLQAKCRCSNAPYAFRAAAAAMGEDTRCFEVFGAQGITRSKHSSVRCAARFSCVQSWMHFKLGMAGQ